MILLKLSCAELSIKNSQRGGTEVGGAIDMVKLEHTLTAEEES